MTWRRRNFLKLTGASVAAATPVPLFAKESMGEVVDLSHVFGEDAPHIFGADYAPTREKIKFLSEVIHWQQ